MLEALDLGTKLSKSDYKKRFRTLQRRLHQLQRACWKAELATVVVFEGWDAAGKGTVISKLTERLEPRGFSLHAIREPRTYENHLPWMWRYWVKVPNWGEMAIFDRSWYGRVVVERIEGLVDAATCTQAYGDIVSFERTLADDRYAVVKFFLHISRDEEEARFKALESDPHTSWQVDAEDWKHLQAYDDYRTAIEETLERTETEWAPWNLIAATDRRWTHVRVFELLAERMEEHLLRFGHALPSSEEARPELGHSEVSELENDD